MALYFYNRHDQGSRNHQMANKNSIALMAWLAAPLLSFFTLGVYAENANFKLAVDTFKQGYNECTQAQRIRAQDINQAMELFDKYLQLKDKAAKIDPSILTTTEQNISRDIEFCENARQDILRTKAFPIMENALNACEESKNLLAKSNMAEATNAYKRYEDLYKKAIEVTPSITKVSSVSIKIGRCENLKKKIDVAADNLIKIEATIQNDYKQAAKALETCNSAEKLINVKQPSQPNIAKTTELLRQSENEIAPIIKKRETSANSNLSSLRSYQQVTNAISSTKKCQNGLSATISTASAALKKAEESRLQAIKEKSEQEKALAEKARLAREAQEKSARELKETEAREKAKQEELNKLNALKQKEAEERLRAEQAQKQKEEEARNRLKEQQKTKDWSVILENTGTATTKTPSTEDKKSSEAKKTNDWRDLTD